jgi:hypothetical protein
MIELIECNDGRRFLVDDLHTIENPVGILLYKTPHDDVWYFDQHGLIWNNSGGWKFRPVIMILK